MSLVELAELIALKRDRVALKELHNNRVIGCQRGGHSLHLVEYVQKLSQGSLARRWCGYDAMAVAKAYDLTVDKFSRLPADGPDGSPHKPGGADCRYYFTAFITYVRKKSKAQPSTNSIEAEILATESLRKLVTRHFYLSCLESRRRAQKRVRRYVWKVDGRALYLWLPLEMPGRRCRSWLEANVSDVDLSRPGEQQRVQEQVDRLLGRPTVLSVERIPGRVHGIATETDPAGNLIKREIQDRGLVHTIADEKAETIDLQRPAISCLGAERLRQLVHSIFDSLSRCDFQADRIAASFGLSQTTLSRFAGSRWKAGDTDSSSVTTPDLWRNTAQTLARHPDFVAIAKHAGVWKRVTNALLTSGPKHKEQ
jgi:hypothetical protein